MKIKLGLLGLGHLGKIHKKCIDAAETLELVGVYDADPNALKDMPTQLVCHSIEELLERCEAVDIVTPTVTHAELATMALQAGKHVFIEKPVTSTPDEARALLQLQEQAQRVVQVGHVERFNPALMSVNSIQLQPKFLEVHRLASFNPRGTDVSVVHDLMIHDLDILLHLIKSEIKEVRANGVAVMSDTADIANARIEWSNGCIANVTASRISLKSMRKMRIFQEDAYIALDFLERTSQVIQLSDAPEEDENSSVLSFETSRGTKHVRIQAPTAPEVNAIQLELEQFASSVRTHAAPPVSLEDGVKALELAHQIEKLIKA